MKLSISHIICITKGIHGMPHIYVTEKIRDAGEWRLFGELGRSEPFLATHICGNGEMSTEISDTYTGRWGDKHSKSRHTYMWIWAIMGQHSSVTYLQENRHLMSFYEEYTGGDIGWCVLPWAHVVHGINLNLWECEAHWFANAGGRAKKALRRVVAAIEHSKTNVCCLVRGERAGSRGRSGLSGRHIELPGYWIERSGGQGSSCLRNYPQVNPKFGSRDQFNAAAMSCNADHLQVVPSPQQHPNVYFWCMRKIWHARE